jgi:hypothetical protein
LPSCCGVNIYVRYVVWEQLLILIARSNLAEPPYVVDHQGPFGALCAEPLHVVDHQGRFGADSASNPSTWSRNWIESASSPSTWSTTSGLSVQDSPNPSTWSTTISLSVFHILSNGLQIGVKYWPRALFTNPNIVTDQNPAPGLIIAGDQNGLGMEPAAISGVYAANKVMGKTVD